MRKSDVRSASGVSPMQLRDARAYGLIEEPTPVRRPGQFNAESVYASDTMTG